MSTGTNSSMQMALDNFVRHNTNDGIPNGYQPPPISEKTQRELAASAEQFMRSRSQENNPGEKKSRPSSGATREANSKSDSNANSSQSCLPDKDKDVEMKPPETNLKSDEKAENNASS